MNKIMDGKKVRDLKLEKLKNIVNKLDKQLTLCVISVGENPASKVYIKQKEKFAKLVGYDFLNLHFDKIKEEDLINKIIELNEDNNITGIIVQLPLPD